MKALTVLQPSAWAIVHAGKAIENRAWSTRHRGLLLIHAGVSRARLGHYGPGEPPEEDLVFGALIGTARLVDCVPIELAIGEPFASVPWCWRLTDPRPFEKPIPYVGRQQLFDVPDEFLRNPAEYLLFRAQ